MANWKLLKHFVRTVHDLYMRPKHDEPPGSMERQRSARTGIPARHNRAT